MAQGGWNPPPGGYAPPPGGHAPPPGGHGPPPGGGYGPPGGHGPPPGGFAPPPHQPHYQQAPSAAAIAADSKGFFAGLFDFSFENFVALKVMKVLYGLFLLALAGGILFGLGGAVLSMINGQFLAGLGMLVVMPFAALLYLILGRVYFELIVVAFKIAEDADEIAKNTRK